MLKKKADRKFWERRYFRIIKSCLYWYQDRTSSVSQNSLPFSTVTDVFPADSDKPIFHVKCVLEGGLRKEYQLQCGSEHERNGWLAAIIKEIRKTKEDPAPSYEPTKIEDKATLFVDYEAMGMDLEEEFGDMPEEPRSPAKSPRREPNSPFGLSKKESKKDRKEQAAGNSSRLKEWKEANLKPLVTDKAKTGVRFAEN